MPPDRDLPAFELLADELRRSLHLSDWQVGELRRVFGGFGGQRIDIPRRQWRLHKPAAILDARRWLEAGDSAVCVRDRLMARYHVSQRTAHGVIQLARSEAIDGAV